LTKPLKDAQSAKKIGALCACSASEDLLKAKQRELDGARARAEETKAQAVNAASASKAIKRQVAKEIARQARAAERDKKEQLELQEEQQRQEALFKGPTPSSYEYATSPVPGLSYDLRRYNFADDV